MKREYTQQKLARLVVGSTNFNEVARKLGWKKSGSGPMRLKQVCTERGIDFSHFTGMAWAKMRPFEALYNRFVYNSEKRGKRVQLCYEEFLEFTKITACCYCDLAVDWIDERHAGYNLDRIENDVGYTKKNCVVCCRSCNVVKGRWVLHERMLRSREMLQQIRR